MTNRPHLNTTVAAELLTQMSFRCIGPPRGGRVVAVAGDPEDPAVFYFGSVAGGVWKTQDAGITWINMSDGWFATSSVGALTVSDSDPNVIYVGMGEATIRGDVSHGDGIYRSSDGGQTWEHLGLEATRHISEIIVHPRDPDRVLVAAFGHAFGPNPERGVYRSDDGGRSWDLVLHVSEKSGAADLAVDPRNPEVIYASMWEGHRNFWEMSSGGPDSGLWRSTDGGDTWTELTGNEGLPPGLWGKVGLAASPARAGRVWALIESVDEPGLYRSDDSGQTWKLVSDRNDLRYRPWYYMHVFADPVDADTVYVNNLNLWRSNDGGQTFTQIGTPHSDNHDLWIDPADPRRMIQSNDGGANVSFNGGASWSSIYNQLTAQLYTVTTDNREPYYHVYGTQQDNSSIAVPSDTNDDVIAWTDCYPAGTGESGFMAVDPTDDDIVYVGAIGSSPGGGGALQRYDHRTGQIQLVNVWPEAHGGIGPGELTYRFPWTFPIVFSPHDPGLLYTAGNVVFRTTDQGHSWEPISPDLSRNDPEKLVASGGPITKDTSGAEHYCSVSTLRESPHEPGVLWAGSDDGLVHVTRDGGANWSNVTPPELPEWAFVRTVEPSSHDPATVYVAATRYKLDDTTPYVFKTNDNGASWTSITGQGAGSLPDETIVRVIREDPEVAGLLYLGTETGLFLSSDDGASWIRWNGDGLPVVPIYDLTIKGDDLVMASHGRSFWILDDLTPLRSLAELDGSGPVHLFTPPQAWRVLPNLFADFTPSEGRGYGIGLSKVAIFDAGRDDQTNQVTRSFLDAGTSGPEGAALHYPLDSAVFEADDLALTLTVSDESGQVVRRLTAKPAGWDKLSDEEQAFNPGPWLPTQAGLNQFVWDLRHEGAHRLLGNKTAGEAAKGPLVLPGRYRLELSVEHGGQASTSEGWVDVVNDPRVEVGEETLVEQLQVLLSVRDKVSEAHQAVERIRSVREQLEAWLPRLASDNGSGDSTAGSNGVAAAAETADQVMNQLADIEGELIKPGEHRDTFGLNDRARLNEKLAALIPVIASADARPTTQVAKLVEVHSSQIDEQLARLEQLETGDVARLNQQIAEAQIPAIS